MGAPGGAPPREGGLPNLVLCNIFIMAVGFPKTYIKTLFVTAGEGRGKAPPPFGEKLYF